MISHANNFAAARHQDEIAENKRKEYEEWLRTQEMEAYRLEYDCSVKYEEHKPEKEESVQQQQKAESVVQQTVTNSSQITTNYSKKTHLQACNDELFLNFIYHQTKMGSLVT